MKTENSLMTPSTNRFYIIDIDSTLVTTHQRNQQILQDWVSQFSSDFPEDTTAMKTAQCQLGDYGYTHALKRIEFTEKNTGSLSSLQQFWNQHFFSNDYLYADQPTEGAIQWVNSLKKQGVNFIYLTARHKKTMWDGTLSSLKDLGFPIHHEILFLKEDLSTTDEDYKAQAISKTLQEHPDKELILIDNEPVVLHRILQSHPTVQLVWFESTHSGKMSAPSEALAIKNFCFS